MHAVRVRTSLLVVAVLLLALALTATTAQAGPRSATTAAVSMGDSYISGEAGRWAGNSVNSIPPSDGTDRSCDGTGCDPNRVYVGGTYANGCHRSDVAEILSAQLAVDRRVNIACSGAVTDNIYRSSNGGVAKNGEPPQADQLLPVAKNYNVRVVFLSIGGNDLGFASIVQDCFTRYSTNAGPCSPSQQVALQAKLPVAQAKVEKAITEIRAVMKQAGYKADGYRLVLQGYPSVVPRAGEARYDESVVDPLSLTPPVTPNPQRSTYGCPFYNLDLDWARDSVVTQIGGMVKAAAQAKGTEFLGLSDAFQGHEICSASDSEVTPLKPPSPTTSEWGRALSPSAIEQGQTQEVFHPDAFGQQALGTCVGGVFAQTPGIFNCTGGEQISPAGMTLTRSSGIVQPPKR